MKKSSFLLLTSSLLLTACYAPAPQDHGQYWQRASVSDAAYQQGPKAQQMLDRDIARCVTELRELEKLGAIQNAIPPDLTRTDENPNREQLRSYDDANREGYLFAEHKPYHNFESCMDAKGWDRVEYVPYDVADRGRRLRQGGLANHMLSQMFGRDVEVKSHSDYDVNQ